MQTNKKQLKEQKEDIRRNLESMYNTIARDQRSLLNSIQLEIRNVSNKKADLLSLKASVNKASQKQEWFLK